MLATNISSDFMCCGVKGQIVKVYFRGALGTFKISFTFLTGTVTFPSVLAAG